MSTAFAIFVFIHAAAHGVGFLTQTFLIGVEDRSVNPAFLITSLARDHWLVRSLGVLWLLVGIGFVIAGVGLLQESDWAVPLLIAATAVSTVLSLMWVKEAPFGLVANLVIVAALAIPALHDRVIPAASGALTSLSRRG